MCWSCNPYCGGCKPPKPKPIKCERCGAFNFDDLGICRKCKQVLPERPKPEAVFCRYIGAMCANPCQRHKKDPDHLAESYCKWHTPVIDDSTA